MRNPIYYDVRPRYTPGSPAQVERATAERVAIEERDAYLRTLEGPYGPEEVERAEKLGLSGIAVARVERRGNFETLDLITGEIGLRPIRDGRDGRRRT